MSDLETKMDDVILLLKGLNFSSGTALKQDSINESDPEPSVHRLSKRFSELNEQNDLESINESLPKGWLAHIDPVTKKVFFQNSINLEVQWDLPDSPAEA